MKSLLIGSRALAFWYPAVKVKETTDYDVISDEPIPGTEWHSPDCLNNRDMEYFASDIFTYINGHKVYVLNPKGLALIKRSHLWRNLSFQKHITHYYKYRLDTVFKHLTANEYQMYVCREKLTHKEFPINHPKLNTTKDDFFGDGIHRKYDHDLLHELVAYEAEPMYKRILGEGEEVKCSKEKWYLLSVEEQLMCAAEEVFVTALERFVLVDDPLPYRLSYIKALDKLCTTMCSGWFRDFGIDNYQFIMAMYDTDKFTEVKEKLGEI